MIPPRRRKTSCTVDSCTLVSDRFARSANHASFYLLNVVVGKGEAVVELLATEQETLFRERNALLLENQALDSIDGGARRDVERQSSVALHEAEGSWRLACVSAVHRVLVDALGLAGWFRGSLTFASRVGVSMWLAESRDQSRHRRRSQRLTLAIS